MVFLRRVFTLLESHTSPCLLVKFHPYGVCKTPDEWNLLSTAHGIRLKYNWIKCAKSVEQLTAFPHVSLLFVAVKMDDFCCRALSIEHYIMTN